ncbi:hypothetical protein CEXT_185841 [Caerostris extrusa]|uniref:Uncharacterized protein n=1 Tax=Caerostris extrusa TaxID=172846 RepID=A0AAV4M601_CAEEX|nr:hypothetical protein CEXT_185841 [Caerostris extrusa]
MLRSLYFGARSNIGLSYKSEFRLLCVWIWGGSEEPHKKKKKKKKADIQPKILREPNLSREILLLTRSGIMNGKKKQKKYKLSSLSFFFGAVIITEG